MLVGICDDSEKDRQKIHRWLRCNHPSINEAFIFEFYSGEALIEFLNWNQLDVLFLDCQMCGLSGIDCAVRIRKKDKKIKIIAITDYVKYALFGYDAEIYRFIFKSDFEEKIEYIFEKIIREHKLFNEKVYCTKTDKGVVRLPVSDIVHIESILRKKDITLADGEVYTVYGKMIDLESFFEPFGFVRIHNSYLVNSVYISRFNYDRIVLSTGTALPVSRKHAKTSYDKLMILLT